MSYTLTTDELLTVAAKLKVGTKEVEALAAAQKALAEAVAAKLGVIALKESEIEGYVGFGPAIDGQPIPEPLQGIDDEGEWGAEPMTEVYISGAP